MIDSPAVRTIPFLHGSGLARTDRVLAYGHLDLSTASQRGLLLTRDQHQDRQQDTAKHNAPGAGGHKNVVVTNIAICVISCFKSTIYIIVNN